jgi:Mg2+ and Co2+ transporter CorA
MMNENKKRVGVVCIYAAIPLLVAAIYGMLFVKPEPSWSKLAYSLGFPLAMIGLLLASWAKRAS